MRSLLQRFLLVITVVSLLIAGCSNGSKAPGDPVTDVSAAKTPVVPDETPDLIGMVKDIVGNEVTVFKWEVGQTREHRQKNP